MIINKNTINSLRKNIEYQFGKVIYSQKDIKQLKEDIHIITKNEIGFNTLRRFFGLLEGTNPNSKTLNILSQYISHKYSHSKEYSQIKKNKKFKMIFYV